MAVEQFKNSVVVPSSSISSPTTTLSAAITSTSATSISVASAAGLPAGGNFEILVDAELMQVTALAGTTLTVTRGFGGTTAATHSSGANVVLVLTAEGLQQLGMTKLAEAVLASAQATITFSTIPQTFRHLKLIIVARASDANAGNSVYGQFNGDTGNNYSWASTFTDGTATYLGNGQGVNNPNWGEVSANSAPASAASTVEVLIPGYSATDWHKTVFSTSGRRAGTGSTGMQLAYVVSHWANTAAITSVTLGMRSAANFMAGSRVELYGLS